MDQVERYRQMKRGLELIDPRSKVKVTLTVAELGALINAIEFTRDCFSDEEIAPLDTNRAELGSALSQLSAAQGAALLKAGAR